ncbi:MAG: hypothetical protein ACJ746_07720 [Bryobacteraceae bacterium]
MKRNVGCGVLAVAVLAATSPTIRGAETLTNGGFESGFSGWSRLDSLGSDGTFALQTGTSSPVNGTAVPAPPASSTAAMTDALGPGSHVLYQDFTLTSAVDAAVLNFNLFVGNRAGGFYIPASGTLDFSVAAFNQQARVDILLGSANPFSVAGSDVLLNAFQTSSGSAAVSGYTSYSVSVASILNSHLNTPLRIRFAETDNVANFQFGVDNVGLQTGASSAVPEPSTFAAGALAGALCLLISRRRRRDG